LQASADSAQIILKSLDALIAAWSKVTDGLKADCREWRVDYDSLQRHIFTPF